MIHFAWQFGPLRHAVSWQILAFGRVIAPPGMTRCGGAAGASYARARTPAATKSCFRAMRFRSSWTSSAAAVAPPYFEHRAYRFSYPTLRYYSGKSNAIACAGTGSALVFACKYADRGSPLRDSACTHCTAACTDINAPIHASVLLCVLPHSNIGLQGIGSPTRPSSSAFSQPFSNLPRRLTQLVHR